MARWTRVELSSEEDETGDLRRGNGEEYFASLYHLVNVATIGPDQNSLQKVPKLICYSCFLHFAIS